MRERLRGLDRDIAALRGCEYKADAYEDLTGERGKRLALAKTKTLQMLRRRKATESHEPSSNTGAI